MQLSSEPARNELTARSVGDDVLGQVPVGKRNLLPVVLLKPEQEVADGFDLGLGHRHREKVGLEEARDAHRNSPSCGE